MSRHWKWNSPPRFPKDQNLQYGERYYEYTTEHTNCYFRFRQGSVPGIRKRKASHRCVWRSQSIPEMRAFFDYEDQFKDAGFTAWRRRAPKSLIDSYDDIPRNHYRGSWKQSTKKRRQWGGEIELLFVG